MRGSRILRYTVLGLAVMAILPAFVFAQSIMFQDESGNIHFVRSLDEVPKPYQDQLGIEDPVKVKRKMKAFANLSSKEVAERYDQNALEYHRSLNKQFREQEKQRQIHKKLNKRNGAQNKQRKRKVKKHAKKARKNQGAELPPEATQAEQILIMEHATEQQEIPSQGSESQQGQKQP